MKKIELLLVICLLGACGFQPLYVQRSNDSSWYFSDTFDTSITTEMAKIKVATIKDRFGQQLRNNLLDLLTPKGIPNDPQYRLKGEVLERTVTQQAMRDDVTATNERIKYRVGYTLYDGADELVRGDSIAFVSYDILADPYSTTVSQKKAEEDAAKIVANDITLRIGAYFHTRFER